MIKYSKFKQDNGLSVIHHQDTTSGIVVFNLMYHVGSKHETPDKTGLAHFLEHMMFEGSTHVPKFDRALAQSGGDSNAFTSPDVTNYYMTLPAQSAETAFWLDSDRMFDLSLTQEAFDVQQKVVQEEFKQRYLSQPYGDIWHVLRDFCFETHGYKWPTIGKTLEQIQALTRDDLYAFYEAFYHPSNAVLVVGGGIDLETTKSFSEKWLKGDRGVYVPKDVSNNEVWSKYEELEVVREVPHDMLYIIYQANDRLSDDFYDLSLLIDVLSHGKSSFLHQELVEKQHVFANFGGYHNASFEKGLLIFSGRLANGVTFEEAQAAFLNTLNQFGGLEHLQTELEKIKNQEQAQQALDEISLVQRVQNLAYCETIQDVSLYTEDIKKVEAVTVESLKKAFDHYLITENFKVLKYKAS